MVGGTTQQQQAPQSAHPSSSSSTAHTTSPEEDDLLKRNTDCVYFLASPLTCKKGNECEYRHSDVARVNPRDCWYWLNGNCLNPKCAFRHPPLDGLVGSDVSTPMVPPAPAQQHSTPYATPKQAVACIFFQKGYCLKGHLCPFLHGPSNSVNNKPTQPGPVNPVTEPPKLAQLVTVHKPVEFPFSHNKQPQPQPQPPLTTRNGVEKKIAPPARVVPPPVMNEPPSNKPNQPNRGHVYSGYHASSNEEYSREPSPGFDVLVDNELEDSGHDYDVDRVDHVDRDVYREHRDYDRYNEWDDRFDVDQLERRSYSRNERESESDLRYRISKQRRGSENGARSVDRRESHADRMPWRDHHHRHPDQEPLSSRLRGRIKIPRRSVSPTKENNSRVEREVDKERRNLSYQNRFRDRITDTNFAGPKRLSDLKSVRTEHQSNDEQLSGKRKYPKMEEDLSFDGPKPLSEILKRKRGINNNNKNKNYDNNRVSSVNVEDSNNKRETEMMSVNKQDQNSVSVDFKAENEKDKQLEVNSVNYGANEVENEGEGEDDLIDEDALLDEELEAYEENKDGDYEYEQMDGEEDYNLDEGEYVDEEGEVGDEYEKNENVVYS